MEVRLLGAHNLETRETRHTCFLVDGVLGIDAGSLMTVLTTEDRLKVRALLLTHRHFDHTRDIPTLGLALLTRGIAIDVYSQAETLRCVRDNLVNGAVYPDFVEGLNGGLPTFRFHPITPWQTFRVLDYQVKAVPMPHPAPAVGYIVRGPSGETFAYTGDTGGQLLPFFQDEMAPRVLFVDMTWPSSMSDLARLTGHLTPSILREELDAARNAGLELPRIVAVHVSFDHHDEVSREVAALARDMDVDISVGYEDMVLREGAIR